jgi:drug/metabolite transporter (DMT)-like permease
MRRADPQEMTRSDWTTLVILSLLWGGSFFFTGVALSALPPLTLVVLRVGIAALALNLLLCVGGPRLPRLPRDPSIWVAFFGMGFLNNVAPFCLIVWGQTRIASGLAAILNATTPLFTVAVAHLLTSDERMTGNRLSGVLIGLAGVVVMVGPDAAKGLGTDLLAQVAVLGAALSYACAGLYGRRFARMGVAPLAVATGQVSASSLMLLPVVIAVDRPWGLPMPGLPVWAATTGTGLLSTAVAYVLYFRILARAGATNLSLVTFLIPISAILLGALILGEHLDPRHLLGMVLIACGLAAIDGRLVRRLFPKRNRPGGSTARAGPEG